MSSITSNFFSSSECERLKSLLKNPEKDLEDIISLLESKVEERSSPLKEPNEYYQSLIDSLTHIGIGIDIVNKDYEILFQNQVLKERFGDFRGKNCFRNYMGLEIPCEFCPMEEALRDNKVEHVELKAADGRSYELISAPFPNPDGTVNKVAEVVIDITERKKTEQKLKESEEKYRILTEQSLMGIFIFQEGRFKYINQAVSDMNGYTIEEMLNWTGSDIAKTIYREDLENIMNRLKRSEQGDLDDSSSSNFRIITKTGQLLWVEEYNKRIEFQGAPASLVTLIDITNRVESEYNLRESEERYRGLINNITDIIFELNINGKCTYVSNQLFEISGFHPEELIGQNLFKFLHPEDFSNIIKEVKEAFNSGSRISADFRLIHKDGHYVPVSSNFNVIRINDEQRFIGVLRDNTEKRKAELKLRESELELIKLNNLKSELLRRTSHELKTPLVSIKGFSDLLLELHREKMDDYVVSTLNEIRKGCVRLENLISDILKTAELESDTIEVRKSEEDLTFLIKVCINELKGLSELRNQTINMEIEEHLYIQIQKEEIHKVISNILGNAIKYTPPNGSIDIKSKVQKDSILISVKDSGMGFTEEEKDRIFKQFGKIERYGQGLDVVSEGSGLGLYISKKILELHDGKIWMESEGRNKGSTFYFSLPLIDKF